MGNNNFGLQPLPQDSRDFQLGAIVTLPALKDLPERFALTGSIWVKDQGDSDFCTAYAYCGISQLQEGVRLCDDFSFAASKWLSGNLESWGQDMRSAAKAHVKIGAIEESDRPDGFTVEEKGSDFLRNIANWPEKLQRKAVKHRKKSFAAVIDPSSDYDCFDQIRASIWKFRDKKQGVAIGVIWGWKKSQVYIDEIGTGQYGHAMYAIGWEGDYLIVVNSHGKVTGRNGFHYFHRKVINHFAPMYGAFMLIDLEKDDAKYYIENGIKWDAGWLRKLLQLFKKVFIHKPLDIRNT
jgi:hypothetical protein